MTFYAVLQSTETVIWDVGSRNRTRLNSRVLSWGGRFPLAAGDRLRFGAVDAWPVLSRVQQGHPAPRDREVSGRG